MDKTLENIQKTIGLPETQNQTTFTPVKKGKNLLSSGKNFFGERNYKGTSTEVCTPVSFYLVFIGIQIFMDFINGMLVAAIIKFPIALIFTTLLKILCQRELTVISWILVFVPFIFTTLISAFIIDNMQNNNNTINTEYINFNIV